VLKGRRSKPDPRFYAGSGKVEEIRKAAEELNAMLRRVQPCASHPRRNGMSKKK
jgi:hypothetical protein